MDDYTSPPAPVQAVAAGHTGPGTWARVGLLGITAAALLAGAILAFGFSAAPAGTLAADTGTNDTSLVVDLGGGPGRMGHGFGGIEVTAISGSSISLKTADGWTRTITVDSGTTYSRSGDTIALADIKVGDEIAFRQTHEDDGSFTIDSVAVIPPHAGGEVTAVSGSTITVEQRDGTSVTIKVNGSTTYDVNGDAATLADVKVGMFLMAEGTEASDGSLTATEVKAADADSLRGGHGFRGPGDGPWGDKTPDATAAPTATSSTN